jgi:hypothetical protein
MSTASNSVTQSVQHDAREPGPESGSALEIPQVAVPRKKCILERVFGAFSISQNGIGGRHELRT